MYRQHFLLSTSPREWTQNFTFTWSSAENLNSNQIHWFKGLFCPPQCVYWLLLTLLCTAVQAPPPSPGCVQEVEAYRRRLSRLVSSTRAACLPAEIHCALLGHRQQCDQRGSERTLHLILWQWRGVGHLWWEGAGPHKDKCGLSQSIIETQLGVNINYTVTCLR